MAAASRARALAGGLVQHGLLAGLLQAAPVAHLRHAAGQLAAHLGGFGHTVVRGRHLLGGHGPQPGAAGVGGQLHHVLCGLQRGDLQALGLALGAPGQGHEVEQAKGRGAFDLAFVAVGEAPQGQVRVGPRDGLHALGIGHAQGRQPGLQAGVVEQGDAHGSVLREGLGQPAMDGLLRLRPGGGVGGGQGGLRHPGGTARRECGHVAAQAIGRHAGAACQQDGSGQHAEAVRAGHGWPFCRG